MVLLNKQLMLIASLKTNHKYMHIIGPQLSSQTEKKDAVVFFLLIT